MMKCFITIIASVILLFTGAVVYAGDFNWMADFNVKAEKDIVDFKAKLATRFKIGKAQVDMVFSNVEKPADAYMIFRLGEMSSKTPEQVVDQYKSKKSQGWGALAKSLGIKPGSKEFHALKRGSDMGSDSKDSAADDGGKKKKGKGQGKKRVK